MKNYLIISLLLLAVGVSQNMLNKKVAFYIMEAIDGSFKNHDKEFDKIIWADSNKAIKLLKYTNEKKLVTKATLLV